MATSIWKILAHACMALDWVAKYTIEPLFEGFSWFLDHVIDAEEEIKRSKK